MKRCLVIVFCLLGFAGFAQESAAPVGGSFGLTGVLQTLTDIYSEQEQYMNPGVGIGLRWHMVDVLMIEALAYFNRYTIDVSGGSDDERYMAGLGLGCFLWFNTSSDFSVFIGPRVKYFQDASKTNYDQLKRYDFEIILGTQYDFSRHFAAYANIGAGFVMITYESDIAVEYTKTNLKLIAPSIGFVFYL